MIHESAYIHPQSLVEEGASIGAGTRVWAFAHILPEAIVGVDCNLCDHTFIENAVRIGDRVTIKSGVYLWDGIEVEDEVFIGPAAVFSNDRFPRSKRYPAQFAKTTLCRGCSIGANATVLPGVRVGRWAMVGAGSVVTRDVADHALVYGNPTTLQGWVCSCGERLAFGSTSITTCECGKSYRVGSTGDELSEIEP